MLEVKIPLVLLRVGDVFRADWADGEQTVIGENLADLKPDEHGTYAWETNHFTRSGRGPVTSSSLSGEVTLISSTQNVALRIAEALARFPPEVVREAIRPFCPCGRFGCKEHR